jgi:hypothetical protein
MIIMTGKPLREECTVAASLSSNPMLTLLLLLLLLLRVLLPDVHAHHHVAGRLGAAGQVAAAMPQPAGACCFCFCRHLFTPATHSVTAVSAALLSSHA